MAKKKPSKADPTLELGARILAGLDERRNSNNRYPCTLREIVKQIAPATTDSEVLAAMRSKPLKGAVISVFANDLDSLAVRKEDVSLLAESEVLLRLLLMSQCSPQMPHVPLSALKSLLKAPLASVFNTHWSERIKQNALPDFVDIVMVSAGKKSKAELHDVRFPRPDVLLSKTLVETLESFKDRQDGSYPCMLGDLLKSLDKEGEAALANAAVQIEPYSSRVITIFTAGKQSIVGFRDDAKDFASSRTLVVRIVEALSKPDNQLLSIDTIAKAKELSLLVRPLIQSAIEKMILSDSLPAGVGALRAKKKWSLFLVANAVISSRETRSIPDMTSQSLPKTPAISWMRAEQLNDETGPREQFAVDFEAAFDRLDRAGGLRNYLKLLELRRALAQYDRSEFDSGLAALRRTRRFTLEGSEGATVTLTDAEKDAGIMEAGNLLTYCSRRK